MGAVPTHCMPSCPKKRGIILKRPSSTWPSRSGPRLPSGSCAPVPLKIPSSLLRTVWVGHRCTWPSRLRMRHSLHGNLAVTPACHGGFLPFPPTTRFASSLRDTRELSSWRIVTGIRHTDGASYGFCAVKECQTDPAPSPTLPTRQPIAD
ncbi:hypothetical protein BDW71DRAFT_182947 [Aspergillus fruticulosus]